MAAATAEPGPGERRLAVRASASGWRAKVRLSSGRLWRAERVPEHGGGGGGGGEGVGVGVASAGEAERERGRPSEGASLAAAACVRGIGVRARVAAEAARACRRRGRRRRGGEQRRGRARARPWRWQRAGVAWRRHRAGVAWRWQRAGASVSVRVIAAAGRSKGIRGGSLPWAPIWPTAKTSALPCATPIRHTAKESVAFFFFEIFV